MTTLPHAGFRPTLVDRVLPRSATANAVLVLGGAAFVAVLAQVTVPMFPVPITGQTLAVVLVGLTLGLGRATASMLVYVLAGLIGAPVFAGWSGGVVALGSTSFGYVLGFVPAAAAAGWLAQRAWDRTILRTLVASAVATVIPFLIGVPWLYVALSNLGPAVWNGSMGASSVAEAAVAGGVTPFLLGGLVKAVVAAVLLPGAWAAVRRIDRMRR